MKRYFLVFLTGYYQNNHQNYPPNGSSSRPSSYLKVHPMYKKYLLAWVAALVLSPITKTVHASPSFDCDKASQNVERLICSDAGLRLSDRKNCKSFIAFQAKYI